MLRRPQSLPRGSGAKHDYFLYDVPIRRASLAETWDRLPRSRDSEKACIQQMVPFTITLFFVTHGMYPQEVSAQIGFHSVIQDKT
jgi:hypothetical protein